MFCSNQLLIYFNLFYFSSIISVNNFHVLTIFYVTIVPVTIFLVTFFHVNISDLDTFIYFFVKQFHNISYHSCAFLPEQFIRWKTYCRNLVFGYYDD